MADQQQPAASAVGEQARSMMAKLRQRSPSSQQFLKVAAVAMGIAVAVVLSGVALAGCGLTLLLATPLFLLFSPVLVPVAAVVALSTGGFVTASGAFLTLCSACSWLYNYSQGRHPVGGDKVDVAKESIANAASRATDKAKDAGSAVQAKAQQVAPVA